MVQETGDKRNDDETSYEWKSFQFRWYSTSFTLEASISLSPAIRKLDLQQRVCSEIIVSIVHCD